MAVMRNIQNPQPPGPTIAKLFGDSGILTPKIKKIRTTGTYVAEWYQRGMLEQVPPASHFKKEIESRFDGIKIVKLQNTHAHWRQGKPIIIATVFFDIIDLQPKQIVGVHGNEPATLTHEQTAIILSFIKPSTPADSKSPLAPCGRGDLGVRGALTSLLETIQRGTLALPAPKQPIALLPASITAPARESVLAQPSDTNQSSTLIANPSPLPEFGEGQGVGLKATQFIRKHGVPALVQQLKREAAEAGNEAQRHYRAYNPPVRFNDNHQQTITLSDNS